MGNLERWRTPLSSHDQHAQADGIESELERYIATRDQVRPYVPPEQVPAPAKPEIASFAQAATAGLKISVLAVTVAGGLAVAKSVFLSVVAVFTLYALEIGAGVVLTVAAAVTIASIRKSEPEQKNEPRRRFYQRQEQGFEEY